MRVFVTGGTGVLGRWVVRLLVEGGEEVRACSRSQKNTSTLRALGAEPVEADLFHRESLYQSMKDCEAVLHLATKIPSFGRFRSRAAWEDNDRIRRDGTRNLVHVALELEVKTLVYPSVCFLYPDSGAAWIDSEKVQPVRHPMTLSTMDAEEQVGRFAASKRRGVSLRMGAFYGPESAQSQQQLKLARWGFAAAFGVEHAYHSMIWISDAAQALVCALRRAPSGIYDVVDDEPLQNGENLTELARAVNRRNLRRMPAWALRWMVGVPIMELLARSQRVANQRFKDSTGWAPQVPSARVGWSMIAKNPE
jgi:2-alkyl-3-oxoalkanoate reductase